MVSPTRDAAAHVGGWLHGASSPPLWFGKPRGKRAQAGWRRGQLSLFCRARPAAGSIWRGGCAGLGRRHGAQALLLRLRIPSCSLSGAGGLRQAQLGRQPTRSHRTEGRREGAGDESARIRARTTVISIPTLHTCQLWERRVDPAWALTAGTPLWEEAGGKGQLEKAGSQPEERPPPAAWDGARGGGGWRQGKEQATHKS